MEIYFQIKYIKTLIISVLLVSKAKQNKSIYKMLIKSKMKNIVIIISAVLLFFIIIIGLIKLDYFRNSNSTMSKMSNYINNGDNKFSISITGCESNYIRIFWKNDISKEILIYNMGEFQDTFYNCYGPNTFNVYYNEKLIAKGGHWKSKKWYTHDYLFNVNNRSDSIITEIIVRGPNGDSCRMSQVSTH